MKKIVIVGRGGFAREVKWLLDLINKKTERWRFIGYIDKNVDGEDVIGDDTYILNTRDKLNLVLAIGNPRIRKAIYEKYKKNKCISFPNIIAPSVCITESICMGIGNIICANNILTVDITLGNFNIINLGCTIGHDVEIGNFTTINPGTNISGNVVVNDCVEIGTGTKIIQGKMIGCGVVIGAGAVVVKDIPDETTAVGVPAKVIKEHKGGESNE